MSPPLSQGRFISLEGGEGAGKSTQARRIAGWLARAGQPVLLTREPGGTPHAEAIRHLVLSRDGWDPMAEAMLISAARREHLAQTIRPALAAGMWVVCDRFVDSTIVYQGYVQGVPLAELDALTALTVQGLMPDLTLVLDVDPAQARARLVARGVGDRWDNAGPALHETLRRGFLAVAAANPARCQLVDAARAPEAVTASIEAILAKHWPALSPVGERLA